MYEDGRAKKKTIHIPFVHIDSLYMYIHLFIICHNIKLSKCTLYNNKMQHINVKTSLQSTGTLKDEVGGRGRSAWLVEIMGCC